MSRNTTDLRAVADAFRASLPRTGEILTFRIDAMDRIGVPVVQANLLLPTEPATIGYGYGFAQVEAEVGALGELCEEVHVGMDTERRRAPSPHTRRTCAREAWAGAADALPSCGESLHPDMPLAWVEARRWSSGTRRCWSRANGWPRIRINCASRRGS